MGLNARRCFDGRNAIEASLHRNFLSVFRTPAGFPEQTPLIRDTFKIAKFVWWVHKNFTPTNRKMAEKYAGTKNVFHLRSPQEIREFCAAQSLWRDTSFWIAGVMKLSLLC
jgi:hypothetical protein